MHDIVFQRYFYGALTFTSDVLSNYLNITYQDIIDVFVKIKINISCYNAYVKLGIYRHHISDLHYGRFVSVPKLYRIFPVMSQYYPHHTVVLS